MWVTGGSWGPSLWGTRALHQSPASAGLAGAGCDFPFDAVQISLAMQDGDRCGQITGRQRNPVSAG